MSTNAAKMSIDTVVLPHTTYCLTSWGYVNKTTLQPIESLYKQTIKTLDNISENHNLLSWENLIKISGLSCFQGIS